MDRSCECGHFGLCSFLRKLVLYKHPYLRLAALSELTTEDFAILAPSMWAKDNWR